MNRPIEIANILLKNKATVREVAKIMGISKSTVHKDLTEKLPKIDLKLYENVRNLLDYNNEIKHIRGGISTKIKYTKQGYHN